MLFLPHKNMERITKFILFVSDQEVVYFGFCSHFPFFLMYYLEISHQELFLLFSAFNSFGCSSQIIKVMKSAMNISVESKIKSLMKAYFHTNGTYVFFFGASQNFPLKQLQWQRVMNTNLEIPSLYFEELEANCCKQYFLDVFCFFLIHLCFCLIINIHILMS